MSYVKLVFFSLFIFSCSTQTLSEHSSLNAKEEITIKPKRIPRKSILPITVGDIIYNTSMNDIIATDLLNNDVLWIKKIYAVVYNEKLEKDVQDVYIDSISYSDNTLIIHNELGQTYFLDLNTQLVYPSSNTNNIIIHEGYQLTISQSLKTEFDFYNASDSSLLLVSKDQCIEQGLLLIDSAKSINLKLSDGNFFTLKKDVPDEQFFGYNFIHFDIKRNIYVLWES